MSNLVKLSEFMNNLEFENDFGQSSLFVGRITRDQAAIGVATAIAAFGSLAIGGIPLAIVVLAAGVNDIMAADNPSKARSQPKVPPTIDTDAEAVYDDYDDEVEQEDYQEPPAPRTSKPKGFDKQSTPQPPKDTSKPQEEEEEESISSEWEWAENREPVEESAPKKRRNSESRTSNQGEATRLPQLPQVTDRTKKDLIRRLKQECPGILRLVKSHPIRMVGKQRTGKSTMAKLICLLRMVLLEGHNVIASTPHYEPANPYPSVFNVVGITPDGRRDYPAIEKEWQGLADRVYACRINSITTVWDEFGLFDRVMDEEQITSVLKSCLRETKKFGEYPIFIVHGETAAFLPGSKGLVTVFLGGTVRVETLGELTEDEDGLEEVCPTGKFTITWLDNSSENGQIPSWLTEKYLLELLGKPTRYTTKWLDEQAEKRRLEKERIEEKVKAIEEKELENLRQDRHKHQGEEFTISSGLKEPLKTIYLYAKEQNSWVTTRDVQRKDFAVLKGKPAKTIRQYLGLLADSGLGEIDEEGKSDSAVSFLAK